MSVCPYCGARAATVHEEINHMNSTHPDVVEARLRRIGELPPDDSSMGTEPTSGVSFGVVLAFAAVVLLAFAVITMTSIP